MPTIPDINTGTVYVGGNEVEIVSLLGPNATAANSPKSINSNERKQIILADPLTGKPLDLQNSAGGITTLVAASDYASANLVTGNTSVAALAAAQTVQALNAQTGTTYTIVLADAGKNVDMSNASANTLTIPTNASVAFPVGTIISVTMAGAGITTIAPVNGTVTLVKATADSLSISAQWKTALLYKSATDTWRVTAS